MQIKRTNSRDKNFQTLVTFLDAELAERDGDDTAFYSQFNGIEALNNVVVLYSNSSPVSCGALKEHEPGKIEFKRMHTLKDSRGKGKCIGSSE